jgi:hypothetical protein
MYGCSLQVPPPTAGAGNTPTDWEARIQAHKVAGRVGSAPAPFETGGILIKLKYNGSTLHYSMLFTPKNCRLPSKGAGTGEIELYSKGKMLCMRRHLCKHAGNFGGAPASIYVCWPYTNSCMGGSCRRRRPRLVPATLPLTGKQGYKPTKVLAELGVRRHLLKLAAS